MPEKIIKRAYARLGLMGNPGDAFGGAALSVTIQDLWAEVTLEPSSRIIIKEPEIEISNWASLDDFQRHIRDRGYYGGRRLMIALMERLLDYGKKVHRPFDCPNFTLSWESIIPNRVGLAGSSALLTAALRVIMAHAKYEIPLLDQVDIVWKTEKENLGIPSGPQDRVAQVYEGLIFLRQPKEGDLQVEELDYKSLPPLFVAINESTNEGTEIYHSNLRERYLENDPVVMEGLRQLNELAIEARGLIKANRGNELGRLMDKNFDIRQSLLKLNPLQEKMVIDARKAGAQAKFAGSGGAIVGTCPTEKMPSVITSLQSTGYQVFQPQIKEPQR
jgi:glucuronokinase